MFTLRCTAKLRKRLPAVSCGVIEPAAHLVNPPHRLAIGHEQQDGAVVDDDLHVALVVLDAWLVVLDRVAGLGIAIGAAKVEEVAVEEREHILRWRQIALSNGRFAPISSYQPADLL